MPDVLYDYTFDVWPDETWDFDRAMFDLFRILNRRCEMPFTEEKFERFRSGLSHHGITLRGVVRRLHKPFEAVL